MSKAKAPLFSLSGRGSIGNSLTLRRRLGVNILEQKPIPTDQQTLLQMYHRWLFEDYTYLWQRQSDAVKDSYKVLGRACGLTGFQYWQSYMLTNLPDIAGMWHLDEKAGSYAQDFSRNGNHATIFGSTSVHGSIDNGLRGDGINDYLACGTDLSLCGFSTWTMEYFIYLEAQLNDWVLPLYRQSTYYLGLWFNTLRPVFRYWQQGGGVSRLFINTEPLVQDQVSHLAITFDGLYVHFYINGVPKDVILTNLPNPMVSVVKPLYLICFEGWVHQLKGWLDHVVIYSRLCDDAEIKRHAERRYPL